MDILGKTVILAANEVIYIKRKTAGPINLLLVKRRLFRQMKSEDCWSLLVHEMGLLFLGNGKKVTQVHVFIHLNLPKAFMVICSITYMLVYYRILLVYVFKRYLYKMNI